MLFNFKARVLNFKNLRNSVWDEKIRKKGEEIKVGISKKKKDERTWWIKIRKKSYLAEFQRGFTLITHNNKDGILTTVKLWIFVLWVVTPWWLPIIRRNVLAPFSTLKMKAIPCPQYTHTYTYSPTISHCLTCHEATVYTQNNIFVFESNNRIKLRYVIEVERVLSLSVLETAVHFSTVVIVV